MGVIILRREGKQRLAGFDPVLRDASAALAGFDDCDLLAVLFVCISPAVIPVVVRQPEGEFPCLLFASPQPFCSDNRDRTRGFISVREDIFPGLSGTDLHGGGIVPCGCTPARVQLFLHRAVCSVRNTDDHGALILCQRNRSAGADGSAADLRRVRGNIR